MTLKLLRSPFVGASSKCRSRTSFFRPPRPTPLLKGSKPSNIKVCVRIRPPNEAEKNLANAKLIVRPLDDTVLVFDPYEAPPEKYYKGRLVKDIGIRRNKDLKYAFDSIFDFESTNSDVFECTTKKMLDHLMDGVNCSIFAYGATGAGKTFTMLGTYDSPGVIARTMNELYARIEAVKDDLMCSVEISYLEIYNETVRDLLNPQVGLLAVREDGGSCITISGLSLHKPTDAEHLFRMLEDGNKNRTQHPTDANKESSRSHAVFQVHLRQSPKTADLSSDVLVSKMALVDLAGSERATATRNCGDRMREGANINRSLLALGNCINALAEGKKGAHIPYRDSKLTRILKDALGGNCHTVMIANVSPSISSYDDTQNTLKYANRAKQIKADLRKNVFRVDQHIHQYGKIVQDLHVEIDDLKLKYRQAQSKIVDLETKLNLKEEAEKAAQLRVLGDENYRLMGRVPEEVRHRLAEYISLQDQILSLESQRKLVKKKVASRERIQRYLNSLDFDPTRNAQDLSRTARIKSQCELKIRKFDTSINELKFNLNETKNSIADSIKFIDPQDETLRASLSGLLDSTKICQIEAANCHLYALLKIERQKSQQFDKFSRIIGSFCSLTREQHLILSSYDRLTTSLKCKFEELVEILQSNKDVTWLDDEPRRDSSNGQFLHDYALQFSPLRRGLAPTLASPLQVQTLPENFYSSDDNSDRETTVDDSAAMKGVGCPNRTYNSMLDHGFCETPSSSLSESNSSVSSDGTDKRQSLPASNQRPIPHHKPPEFPTLSFPFATKKASPGALSGQSAACALRAIENRPFACDRPNLKSPLAGGSVNCGHGHGASLSTDRSRKSPTGPGAYGHGLSSSATGLAASTTDHHRTNGPSTTSRKSPTGSSGPRHQSSTTTTSTSATAAMVKSASCANLTKLSTAALMSSSSLSTGTASADDGVFKRPAPPPPLQRGGGSGRQTAGPANLPLVWRPRPLGGKSPTMQSGGGVAYPQRSAPLPRSPSFSTLNSKAAELSAFM